ncbi:MAG TPA: hypothetical protein IAD47_02960 [Candidatus Limihabitans stercoravium]|nr:hypothetical protein [Candidatus Limihabitans stercoravium]
MKNVVSLTDLKREEISLILETAVQMRRLVMAAFKKGPQLVGKTVANLFRQEDKHSMGFQLASGYMSANSYMYYGVKDLFESCCALDNMGVNTIVVQCDNDNMVAKIAESVKCSLVNGGSAQSDPVGVLADLLALQSKMDSLRNLTVLAVGNRQTNKITELSHCLSMYGSGLVWYLPNSDFSTQRKGVVVGDINSAFAGADAVIDLGLNDYSDPQQYYGTVGGISSKLMDMARVNAPLLGARNVVDSIGVKTYANSIVNTRDSCYVAVAMALLYILNR